MKKDSFVKDALVLCAITLISGFALGAGYSITKEPIAETNRKAVIASYEEVMPAGQYDEESGKAFVEEANAAGSIAANNGGAVIESAVVAKDAAGTDAGYIVTAYAAGYAGNVKVVVGVTPDMKVSGISYPEALPETPGLGQKATQPKFYEQFAGKGSGLSVVKAGQETGAENEIDSISGATITSKAVTSAVNAATEFTGVYFLGMDMADSVSSATGAAGAESTTGGSSGAAQTAADAASGPTDETNTLGGAAQAAPADAVSGPTDETNTLGGPAKEVA